jgi:hypothetical protein
MLALLLTNYLCMDDLDRLVVVDAQESAAAASSSSVVAAAAATPQADQGSKNGQYRLFAMVSHLGKNTSSGATLCFLNQTTLYFLFAATLLADAL